VIGSEAYLIGDRIAPQTTSIDQNGVIMVNYADRKPSEPYSVPPSEGKTLRLKLDPATMRFGIVANIAGEADPSRLSLAMKPWVWQSSELPGGVVVTPKQFGKFVLTFTPPEKVSISTDCNAMGGRYISSGKQLSFDQVVSTQMFCDGSQEGEFSKELSGVTGFQFTSKGELQLLIKDAGGMMFFK
jgi:heat shock protein HslJ